MSIRTPVIVLIVLGCLAVIGAGVLFLLPNVASENADTPQEAVSNVLHSLFPGEEKRSEEEIHLGNIGDPPDNGNSYLTGLPVPNPDTEVFIGIMVEESIFARGEYRGVEDAEMAFEMPAEGGVPRMLLIYSNYSAPEQVGPVRSARPYFIDIAEAMTGAYVHAGGSPEALEMLRTSRMIDIDELNIDTRLVRNNTLPKPHNLFAVPKEIYTETEVSFLEEDEYLFSPQLPKTEDAREQAHRIDVNFSTQQHAMAWEYQKEDNCYLRQQYHEKVEICVENVVILETNVALIEGDEKNRLDIRTTGTGNMKFFRDGVLITGKWKRTTYGVFQFFDETGERIPMVPGKTFVQVVDTMKKVTYTE